MDESTLTAAEEEALAAIIVDELHAAPDPLQELSAALGIRREASARELSEVLGITTRRVEALAAEGWIESSEISTSRRLRFPLLRAVQQYVSYLRER